MSREFHVLSLTSKSDQRNRKYLPKYYSNLKNAALFKLTDDIGSINLLSPLLRVKDEWEMPSLKERCILKKNYSALSTFSSLHLKNICFILRNMTWQDERAPSFSCSKPFKRRQQKILTGAKFSRKIRRKCWKASYPRIQPTLFAMNSGEPGHNSPSSASNKILTLRIQVMQKTS